MEFVTYSESSGFNIIEANNREELIELYGTSDVYVLDSINEIDKVIIDRIRELIN